jgi:hypothetical protein
MSRIITGDETWVKTVDDTRNNRNENHEIFMIENTQ